MRPVSGLRIEAARRRVLARVMGEEAVLRPCVCLRCGNQWWPRQLQPPRRCAKCKSPYWSRARQQKPDKRRGGMRPYFLKRRHAEAIEMVKNQLTASLGALANDTFNQQDRSLSKALEVLKDMKAAGRTWAEMAETVKTEFGAQLDKDQLKALVR
jgi:hypothetical protein